MLNLATAMAVGFAWFLVVLLIFRPEEALRRHVFKVFLLGMIICFPVGFFNTFWIFTVVAWIVSRDMSRAGSTAARKLSAAQGYLLFVLVAPIEELVKYFIVRSESFRLRAFDTVREGVMLAAFSALGFASYENFAYMQKCGFEIIYVRAFLCPPAHMLFSSFFGYYLGLAKTRRYRYRPLIVEGLVLSSLAHGVYNGTCQWGGQEAAWIVILLYLLFFVVFIWGERHRPILSFIAPSLLEREFDFVPGQPVERPRLSRMPGGARTEEKMERILEQLACADTAVVLRAIGQCRGLADQRIYEALKRLEHDPDGEIRSAATRALVPLEKKLDALYDRTMERIFSL